MSRTCFDYEKKNNFWLNIVRTWDGSIFIFLNLEYFFLQKKNEN